MSTPPTLHWSMVPLYSKWHSTETDMLRFWPDFSDDGRQATCDIVKLDRHVGCFRLHRVDHSILLHRLRSAVRLPGAVYDWSESSLTDSTQHISYMFCLLVFVWPRTSVSPYLADDIHLVSEGHRRWLRSSTDRSCAVPSRTHNTFNNGSFAVAGPRVWNSLPAHLRDEDITYGSFRRELKTFCFNVVSEQPLPLQSPWYSHA